MNGIVTSLRNLWNERQKFTFLLSVLSVYIFIIIPLVRDVVFGELLFFIFYFLLLSSGVSFLVRNKKTVILYILIISPFILLCSQLASQQVWLAVLADIFIEFYCMSLGYIIMTKTFAKGHVTVHRIEGAIIVYLLLSFIYAMLFHTIFLLDGEEAFKGLYGAHRTVFMYFSLSTLTTVAFGDITPLSSMARSLSNLEGLTGQLYPAIIIARLVSMGFTPPAGKKSG